MRSLLGLGLAFALGTMARSPSDRTARDAIAGDTLLARLLPEIPATARRARYIVVSLAGRRLWYVDGDSILFAAQVGVGRGTPSRAGDPLGAHGTPRARFVVLRKDDAPLWVPPDWYFAELASSSGRPLRQLRRGDTLRARDGSRFYVAGADVMVRPATGGMAPVQLADTTGERRELVVDGAIVVPPVGTVQRQYPRVLGPRRLVFRDGYAIHGTNEPETIGLAASHGCLRLRNEDMLALFDLVPVGTPVFVQ